MSTMAVAVKTPAGKRERAPKTVVLFSGGMDSVIAWEMLGRPERVYVRIGATYETRELLSLERRGLDRGLTVVDGGEWLGPLAERDGHVPYRNLYFAVCAAAATGADRIVLGATAGETSGDKTRTFAAAASRALSLAEARDVRLEMPFRHLTKRQLIERYMRAIGNLRAESVLRQCPTCYAKDLEPGTVGCGRCMSCVRRWQAFTLNGIEERYMQPPWTAPMLQGFTEGLWRYLRRTPVRDWFGVARLNMELAYALQQQRMRQQRETEVW